MAIIGNIMKMLGIKSPKKRKTKRKSPVKPKRSAKSPVKPKRSAKPKRKSPVKGRSMRFTSKSGGRVSTTTNSAMVPFFGTQVPFQRPSSWAIPVVNSRFQI